MRSLKLKVLDDEENSKSYTHNIILHHVDFPNLKSVVEKLQVHLEEKIYPIVIAFTAGDTIYETIELYFTPKQAEKMLKDILPCPKDGMKLIFRGVELENT